MLGRHVIAAFRRIGQGVVATSRTRPADLPEGVVWRPWDLTVAAGPGQLDALFGDVGAVVHAGAAVPGGGVPLTDQAIMQANVVATHAIGRWAQERGIPMLLVSGAIVYGPGGRGVAETTPRGAVIEGGTYGLSKALADMAIDVLRGQGLRATILRATSIWGNGLHHGKMIPSLLDRAGRGEVIRLKQPVADAVNLVHAADVAAAIVAALRHGAAGVFNVPGPRLYSIEEIARACVRVCGQGSVEIEPTAEECQPTLRFDVDGAAAAAAFGYSPHVELEQGLAAMRRGGAPLVLDL
jgi:nucleoside-diphosphate-sugar epimerase